MTTTKKGPGSRYDHASDRDSLVPSAAQQATDSSTVVPTTVAELLASTDTPYRWAPWWQAAGWSPIPVTRSKQPTKGLTGWEGAEVDGALAVELAAQYPRHNVALRMKRGMLAIDLDAYHGGLDTMALAVQRWGELPSTIYSTNRDDGSGIFYYRCEPELLTVGNLDRVVGKGVDLIQRHHRFAVVCGTHASGRRYRTSTGDIFRPGEAAELPQRWAEGLRKAKHAEIAASLAREAAGGSRSWASPSRRLNGVLEAVAKAPEGERNSLLFWSACRAFELLGSPELPGAGPLAELLQLAASWAGLPASEAAPTIASARRTVGR